MIEITEKEKLKLKVVHYALHYNYQYNCQWSLEKLYDEFTSTHDKYLVNLFKSVDKLKNFLYFFPDPKENDIRKIKDKKLKDNFVFIRRRRKSLKDTVLTKAIDFYNNAGELSDKDIFYSIEEQFRYIIRKYMYFLDWEKRLEEGLKKVKWIQNY